MADKNQLKIADQVDLADDDPFAELTRIMGFDPREPARRARDEAPANQPAAAQPSDPLLPDLAEDDFSLDLEKELLGGFALDDEPFGHDATPAAGEQPVDEGASFVAASEFDAPAMDFDFSGDFDAAMTEAEAFAAPPEHDPLPDIDLSGELDAALAASEGLGVPEDYADADAAVAASADREADDQLASFDIQPDIAEPEIAFDADLEAAFAAAAADQGAGHHEDARDPQTDAQDMSGAEKPAPLPLPVTPEAVAQTRDGDMDADLDAAMADIDMDFLGDVVVSQPLEAAPEMEEAGEPVADLDPNLFQEDDFRLDEPDAVLQPETSTEAGFAPENEDQPEIDAALLFDDEDLRLDDIQAAGGHHEPQPQSEEFSPPEWPVDVSFDDVDFGSDLQPAVAAQEPQAAQAEPAPVASEAAAPVELPRYEPRRLPTSPMDVAAEEFRQRDAGAASAEQEFNLEDELNALLGNIKGAQEAASAQVPSFDAPPPHPAPSYEHSATPRYEPAASSLFGSAGSAFGYESPKPAEPVGFEAPEHPVDIGEDLNWELDAIFPDQPSDFTDEHRQGVYASGAAEEPVGQSFGSYLDSEQPQDFYAEDFDVSDQPEAIELDDDFASEAQGHWPAEQQFPYRDAVAGAAIGAAAAGYAGSFAHAGSARDAVGRASVAGSLSPHRDPVVRGNPLKEDPLDVITALAEKYSKKEPITPYGRAVSAASGAGSSYRGSPADEVDGDIDISDAISDAFDQPEVETIEVADQPIALADDLDIPELPEEDEHPVAAYDDLDAEFSSLLNDMNAENRAAQPAARQSDTLAGGFDVRSYQSQFTGAVPGRPAQANRTTYDDDLGPDSFALDPDDLPGSRAPSDAQYAVGEYDYDPDLEQDIAPRHMAAEGRRPRSRGMLLAALVGGVAIVGAVGAFAFSFGGGDEAPAIVRADGGPVKVKPENPGGSVVPNQDNKVYETVAGQGTAGAPQQEKLVTTAEEPVDVAPPAVEETASASGKSEDRIEQILQEAENKTDDEIAAVAPRKVRTMVVRPDGTLVPREDEPAAAASTDQTDTIAAVPPAAAPAPEATGAVQESAGETAAAAITSPETLDEAVVAEEAPGERAAMPETAPIAPQRPTDQPVQVVGEVKPDQVAAVAPAAAAAGNWAMQIASQPTEAAAQASYQDLARRYGSVLQGREVNIVKAEIAGKGTFWRVRVPASSRNEAIGLCESYKAAGGNCFVSR